MTLSKWSFTTHSMTHLTIYPSATCGDSDAGRQGVDGPANHHLSHCLNKQVSAATLLRPQATAARFFYPDERGADNPLRWSTGRRWDFAPEVDMDAWISSPSIPKTHMPLSVMERQVDRGWNSACRACRYVREQTVNTGRDSIKFSQWNDISE